MGEASRRAGGEAERIDEAGGGTAMGARSWRAAVRSGLAGLTYQEQLAAVRPPVQRRPTAAGVVQLKKGEALKFKDGDYAKLNQPANLPTRAVDPGSSAAFRKALPKDTLVLVRAVNAENQRAQIQVIDCPDKAIDVAPLGWYPMRWMDPAPAPESGPKAAPKTEFSMRVDAVDEWAAGDAAGSAIEHAFPPKMADMLLVADAVSPDARERLLACFPAASTRMGAAVGVVRLVWQEDAESTPVFIKALRSLAPADLGEIRTYLTVINSEDTKRLLGALGEADQRAAKLAADIEADPVGTFKRELAALVVSKLRQNRVALDGIEQKYAKNTKDNSPEWKELRERVAPLMKKDLQTKDELVEVEKAHGTLKGAMPGEEYWDNQTGQAGTGAEGTESWATRAIGSVEDKYRVPEADVPQGTVGTFDMWRVAASVKMLAGRIEAMQAARAGFRAEYPIASALEEGELESGASNEAIMAKLRTGVFQDLRTTLDDTMVDVEKGDIDLHTLDPRLINETRIELGYDKNPKAKEAVERWLKEEHEEDQIIEAAIGGAVMTLSLAALVATGGTAALVLGALGSAIGMAGAIYNVEKAADQQQLASAGTIGNEMVADADAAKFGYWMAVFDAVLSVVDLKMAADALAQARRAGDKAVKGMPKKAAGSGPDGPHGTPDAPHGAADDAAGQGGKAKGRDGGQLDATSQSKPIVSGASKAIPPNVEAGMKAAGMTEAAAAETIKIAQQGYTIQMRPTTKYAAKHLMAGHSPKPEFLKMKTVNDIDVKYLGWKKEQLGLVGYKMPTDPGKLDGLTPADAQAVRDRFASRKFEYETYAQDVAELVRARAIKVRDGVVFDMRKDSAGRRKAFTGDYDIFDVRGPNGEELSKDVKTAVVEQLKADPIRAQHGAHVDWETKSAKEAAMKEKMIDDHRQTTKKGTPGEALAEFRPDGTVVQAWAK